MASPSSAAAPRQAVILAGGFGTRLRPFTCTRPKPVLPLCNLPFLAYQIDLLRRHGVEEVILATGYQPDAVREVFGDGEGRGVRITYSVEPKPLDTGGAIKHAAPLLGREPFFALNGDVLMEEDLSALAAFHRETGAAVTILLRAVEDPTRFGLVETTPEGRVTRFLEKPKRSEVTTNTINAGVYLIDPATLALMEPGVPTSIERVFFPQVVAEGLVFTAHAVTGYWIDIGTPAQYREAQGDLMGGRFQPPLLEDRVGNGRLLGQATRIAPDAVIGEGTVLGDGVVVGAGSVIREATLFEECQVGENSEITGAMLGCRCRIGSHVRVREGTLLGDETVVPDYSVV